MQAEPKSSARESRPVHETVVVADLVGYSTLARLLEQNTGAAAVSDLNRQIQAIVERALGSLSSPEDFSRVAETGDGAILVFHSPTNAHLFAEQLHIAAERHNRARTEQSATRHFRVGIATGEVSREDGVNGSSRYAGIAISDAVRLQTAAQPGETLIDSPTFAVLAEEERCQYGAETTVHGKRSETFRVRRYRVIAPGRLKPLKTHHLPNWLIAFGAIAAPAVTALGLWLHFHEANPAPQPQSSSANPVLQRIQVKPIPVRMGGRLTVTVELDRPAPKGGVSVDLTSSDPAILTVDGNALVPQGQTMGTGYSQAVAVPNYPSPIAIVATYNNESRRADVNVLQASPQPSRDQIRTDVHRGYPQASPSRDSSNLNSSTPETKTMTNRTELDSELLSRLEEAQGRLTAEDGYWTGVRRTMPQGSSLRPEITSQLYAAESSSKRCERDRQAVNSVALSSCIDSLNDHITQLRLQH